MLADADDDSKIQYGFSKNGIDYADDVNNIDMVADGRGGMHSCNVVTVCCRCC